MKIHLLASCGKIRPPSTVLPRDFCAGICPLQVGVVLVISNIFQGPLTTNDLNNHLINEKKLSRCNSIQLDIKVTGKVTESEI